MIYSAKQNIFCYFKFNTMIQRKFSFRLSLLLVLFSCSFNLIKAQLVGTSAYIRGTSVEIGIDGLGGYEGVNQGVSPPPAGYHARTTTLPFGFVANPQVNAWATYDGDFFTPGSPENGWGFEIGTTGGVFGTSNCSNFGNNIFGAFSSWTHTFDCYNAIWEGDMTSGTDLHFKIDYFLQQTDLYYTTTVSVTNNTAAVIPELFYYRNFDPDNNQEIGFDFTTTNTVVSQPGFGGCNLAHVSATSTVPASQPMSYCGLAAIGNNWRAMYGGFSNRDASDIWNGTGLGFVQTVGASNFQDEAIALAYKISNLAPGATETFKFVVILDNASATAAIDNILYFSYPGSASAPPAVCTPFTDTVRTCGGPVPITINGSIVNDFTWTWTPTAGLTPITGPSIVANPPSTTTYTAVGTPLSACVAPVTLTFVVEVTPGGGTNPVITAVPPLCVSDPPVTFTADTAGGTWTAVCGACINSTTGVFNPTTAGAGTYLITYTTTNSCNSTDTMIVTVSGSDPTIAPVVPVCAGSAAFTMTAASPGGVWSGGGISAAGLFNPTTAGTYTVSYTISGTCAAVDTQLVVVNPTVPPTTGFSYTTPVCISGTNPVPTTVAGFTTGGTFSATPAGLGLNTTNGNVNLSTSAAGTYTVTYNFLATGCGPAGSSTATLVITPLSIPVTTFSYPIACASDTADAVPLLGAGFTPGGTFSSSPGLVINDSTGVVDVNASTPGSYTVTYSIPSNTVACSAAGTGTATMTINPLPTILIGPEQTIWLGGLGAWIYATGGTTYSWSPVTNLSCPTCDSTFASPTETTTFCVTVTELGCIDSACVKMNVEIPCSSNRNLGVPNAFSPNNDGINDKFCLDGWSDCVDAFEILIFDRWGEKVYESKDPDFCWDGIYKGRALDPAVFVYFIKATYAIAGDLPTSPRTSFDVNKTGNISLVR